MRKIGSVLAPAAYVPGLLFEALVRARSRLYRAALLPQHRLPGPVISIGNITMGGAGKTPLVIYVAETLLELGLHPAVLSRGYGRRNPNKARILPPGTAVPSPASTLGDEPALVRRHTPSAWMGISKDRFRAGTRIAEQQPRPAFILDDGFQHRGLHRDLDIVIVDRSQPLGANRIFPRGTLREPVSEMARCHMVVINGAPEAEGFDRVEAEVRTLNAGAMIFRCSQTIRSMVPFPLWQQGPERPSPDSWVRSAYLVAALGNPERFGRDIRRLGIEVRGSTFFADHHWLKPKDWLACIQKARSAGAEAIITTEKDAVKISHPPDFPLLVSVQSTEMSDAGAFKLVLKHCVEEHP
jgi:tetraacyldisaccharide 4'-kinase